MSLLTAGEGEGERKGEMGSRNERVQANNLFFYLKPNFKNNI